MNPAEADFWGVRFAGPFRRFPQAFMSAPFCAALAWKRGDVRFADLHVFDDPDVTALSSRVTVIADPERHRYDPLLNVTLTDGRRLESEEDMEDYPLRWTTAVSMARALGAEVGLPAAAREGLITSVEAIDRQANIDDVVAVARTCVQSTGEAANAA